MKTSEVLSRVIALSNQIQAYYKRELVEHHPLYPLLQPEDAPCPPPPEQEELRLFLSTLPDKQIFLLLALMRVGRQELPASGDLLLQYGEVSQSLSRGNVQILLLAKVPLGTYLEDGWRACQQLGINLEEL